MTTSVSSNVTFWQLLTDYRIEVPMIQRDYAQGRQDPRTEQVRKNFVEALCISLNKQTPLHLDFVYGSVAKDTLTLLDGQQRLTTLFLLHWYIANQCSDEIFKAAKQQLKKFTYQTRISSREFCDALCNEKYARITIKALSLSKHIEDAPWFSRSWSKDPTVTAMLVMLDAIDSELKNKDYEKIWLTITNPTSSLISFQFLPMSQFGLADELYIKMNARGKALTDFENFKAWLERYAETLENSPLPNDWLTKLDTTWADVFWKIKDELKKKTNQSIDNIENFDNGYLNFFKGMGLFSYVANLETSGQKDALKSKENTLVSSLHEEKYVAISSYEAMKCFNTKSLSQMFTVLDACAAYPIQTKQMLSDLVDKPNYWQRARFYALAQFFIHARSPIVFDIQFERWQRVCNNLINNTFINNTLQFARVIKNIRKLSNAVFDDHDGDILAYFKDKPKSLNQLSTKQQVEEVIKAQLIKENPDWEKSIIKVESHPYFDGQIGFLLELSKQENGHDLNLFRQYADKASRLFNDELLISQKDNNKEIGFLVQRALLCQGDKDYLVKLSSERKNFCLGKSSSLREREDNWRGVFDNDASLKLLKTLLDKISLGNTDIKDVLTSIIKDEQTKFTATDWRYYFLKNPSLIAKCNNGKIRIKKNDEGEIVNIFLLSKEL